jgi:hypothetical protein
MNSPGTRSPRQLFKVAFLVLSFAGVASATPVTWTVSGLTFNDGGSVTGSFVFDADASPRFDPVANPTTLATTAGTSLPGYNYSNPLDYYSYGSEANAIEIYENVGSDGNGGEFVVELEISTGQALTDAGGKLLIGTDVEELEDYLAGGGTQFEGIRTDPNQAYLISGSAIPEPGTVWLLAGSLLGLIGCAGIRARLLHR